MPQGGGRFEEKGFRVEVDDRNERVGYKIRDGELEKIPYLLVVGDKETEARAVSVRKRGQGDLGQLLWRSSPGNWPGRSPRRSNTGLGA